MDSTIVIDLDNSQYAHGFQNENQIHQKDLDKAICLIRQQVRQINQEDEVNNCIFLSHNYRTIGIFGDRGSGKTSFLISLLEKCKQDLEEVEILKMVDPTLVEHKKPIILCVIAMINQLVVERLKRLECPSDGYGYTLRKKWEHAVMKVSEGIIAIDGVGMDYQDPIWQDEAYVMHTGLDKVSKTNELEGNIRSMVKTALQILGKNAFVLAFDDIDVDVKQGWNVLESLRRYLSDEHIISIISGNIKLYGTLVRQELCKHLALPTGKAKETMKNELESQYMLKLLNPQNRINLVSLYNLVQQNGIAINVCKEGETKGIENVYKDFLTNIGISDTSTQSIFIDFLLTMSLRSQIHFLNDAWNKNSQGLSLDVFSSRLYAAGIDLSALLSAPQRTNIVILDVLRTKAGLPDCYLLLPTLSNKDINSNFVALTFLECEFFKNDPFLLIDYMLRIGYIRNVVLSWEKPENISRLCRYAGWDQMMSLKNSTGLTIAYLAGKELNTLKDVNISLYGLSEIARKESNNAIDQILRKTGNQIPTLFAMFPFVRVVFSKNNESRSFYSIFVLLATIGEILKCENEEEMSARIQDLQLLRSYQIPNDNDFDSDASALNGEMFGIETDTELINRLAHKMWTWKSIYQGNFLPPYVIGRIITRLYSSLINVEATTVGEIMNLMVANLYNSCLIEETRFRISPENQGKINNSNLRSDLKIFKDNLGKPEVVNQLVFTKWMMSCPMLNCFLDGDTYSKINGYMEIDDLKENWAEISVYNILNTINSKEPNTNSETSSKISFSGGAGERWQNTFQAMLTAGVSRQDIIEHVINEPDIKNAVAFLKDLKIFKVVPKKSVEGFREHFDVTHIPGNASEEIE